jgi:hypothetical protein
VKLREQGAARFGSLLARAERLRSAAMESARQDLETLQRRTLAFLGLAPRREVERFLRELRHLERRFDRSEQGRKPRRKRRHLRSA